MASSQVKAPSEDGAVVSAPALHEVGKLLEANRALGRTSEPAFLGRTWSELRRHARESLLLAAQSYLEGMGEPVPSHSGLDILMTGHQPELYHPGVWIKNFTVHGLARHHGGVPIHLIVDNDTARSPQLRWPGSMAPTPVPQGIRLQSEATAFDHWSEELPWEERTLEDAPCFASFPERIRPPWPGALLLSPFWKNAQTAGQHTTLVGERFAQARRDLERRWGCANLEVRVSDVCQTESYAWFACDLLERAEQLHACYNHAVRDYRRLHALRSKNHPVPDLIREGEWFELPLWVWRSGERRGRLMVRTGPGWLELRTGNRAILQIPRSPVTSMVQAYQSLESLGWKIRSRALTNTLYARLFLCDLFVHGIGGGKYDEVTDALARSFYGIEPPGYLILSGTLLLPTTNYPVNAEVLDQTRHLERDLRWNPQRYLPTSPETEWKKSLWTAEPADPRARREWFRALRAATETLAPRVADRLAETKFTRQQLEQQAAANAILRNREYAFCLFPEEKIRPFCTQFLG